MFPPVRPIKHFIAIVMVWRRWRGLSLGTVKDIVDIVQAGATVIAIILAGLWFFAQREHIPKVNVGQLVIDRNLNKEWTWIRVKITMSNVGKRPINIVNGLIRVEQILPMPAFNADMLRTKKTLFLGDDSEVMWDAGGRERQLKERSLALEPGESDALYYEFIVPAYFKTVKVYSSFSESDNIKNGRFSWGASTIYDLGNSASSSEGELQMAGKCDG